MKETSKIILPGEGLGRIQFGMSREVVRKIAGNPDEIESYQHSGTESNKAEAWHYDEAEISFAFEEFNQWKLTSIAISSDEYSLQDKRLIGMTWQEVIPLLGKMDLGEINYENFIDEDEPDVKLITIENAGLNLWFENNRLTEIQYSQLWEEKD